MWSLLKRASKGQAPFARLRCSFCRRDAGEVARLVAGASAYICDTCVTECVAILREHGGFEGPPAPQRH
jgi:ATP-dependent Clp protease ATP-binding subunit ClpX